MNSPKTMCQIMGLTAFECRKLWLQKRFSYSVAVLTVTTILGLTAIHLRLAKESSTQTCTWLVEIMGKYVNGVNFSIAILGATVFTIMPMIIGIFTATCFAGEQELNQLRTIALRPVPRWAIFLSKFLAMSIFSMFLLLATLTLSYAVGATFFRPSGDIFIWDPAMLVNKQQQFILPESKAWGRLFLIYALSWFTLTYLVALFLMCAALFKKTATAIILPLGFYFSCYFIETMPIMELLKDFLPTRYIFLGKYSMADPILWGAIAYDGLFTLAFTALFLAIGGFVFNSSDL